MKNGKVYIGETRQSLTHRKNQHFSEAFARNAKDKFHQAIREFGKENFVFEEIARSNSFTNLAKLERKLIIEYDSIENGYNTHVRNDTWLIKAKKCAKNLIQKRKREFKRN